jgi:hypothetical protein
LLCSRIGWEDTKLAQQHRPGISNRVLHARRKDQDIAGAVSLRAVLGSTLAPAGENNDHFFGYVCMPGNDNAGADHVLMDRHGLGAEARISDVRNAPKADAKLGHGICRDVPIAEISFSSHSAKRHAQKQRATSLRFLI